MVETHQITTEMTTANENKKKENILYACEGPQEHDFLVKRNNSTRKCIFEFTVVIHDL